MAFGKKKELKTTLPGAARSPGMHPTIVVAGKRDPEYFGNADSDVRTVGSIETELEATDLRIGRLEAAKEREFERHQHSDLSVTRKDEWDRTVRDKVPPTEFRYQYQDLIDYLKSKRERLARELANIASQSEQRPTSERLTYLLRRHKQLVKTINRLEAQHDNGHDQRIILANLQAHKSKLEADIKKMSKFDAHPSAELDDFESDPELVYAALEETWKQYKS